MGIVGGIAWLLMVEKPVVDLRCLKDRNFAVGVVMVSGIGAILYSTNVIIPVMAQQWFGYTALLGGAAAVAGCGGDDRVHSDRGAARAAERADAVCDRVRVLCAGCSVGDSRYRLTPQMDFWTLASFRAFQTMGLAFLFVPNSTLSYSTLPRSLNADATALYSMFRNISGSIGIAVITAVGAERQQAHRAYLAGHLTPYDQPYQDTAWALHADAAVDGAYRRGAHDAAMGLINRTLNLQAAILSYMDLYAYIAAGGVLPGAADPAVPRRCGGAARGALTLHDNVKNPKAPTTDLAVGCTRKGANGMSAALMHAHDNHTRGFVERWLFSTNHKDIGTLYLCFAVFAGTVGTALSIVMRAQLQHPGGTIVTSGQEWNTIITSHGLTDDLLLP